jgi:Cu+-exporting ATPase
MQGADYIIGSYKIAADQIREKEHNVYVLRNGKLLGWIDMGDELRPEAKDVVQYLQARGIKTILLSGDTYDKCKQLAAKLGIEKVIAEQTPEQKLEKVAALSAETPTVMIGDGINDAPALAKATIGISMSEASQMAMQSAHVVLMGNDLKNCPLLWGWDGIPISPLSKTFSGLLPTTLLPFPLLHWVFLIPRLQRFSWG